MQGASALRGAVLPEDAQMTIETGPLSAAGPVQAAPSVPVESQSPVRVDKTPGRNDPCFCGSGKKYKMCHGR